MAFIMNSVEEEPSRGPPPRPVIASSAMKNVNSFDDWIKICLELDYDDVKCTITANLPWNKASRCIKIEA